MPKAVKMSRRIFCLRPQASTEVRPVPGPEHRIASAGIDTGSALTCEHKPSKFQVNGTAGVTLNCEKRTRLRSTIQAMNYTSSG
jgi:hypothetical protein